MSASSLTVAAIGASPQSFSSSLALHRSLHIFQFDSKPIIPNLKLKPFFNFSPQIISSSVSTAFDNIELGQEVVEEEIDDVDYAQTTYEKSLSADNNGVPQSARNTRLYVGNLPFSISSSQLSDMFAEAGRVVFVEIVYDKVTDRNRGFGFVTMASDNEAKEAIRLFHGAQIGGRTTKVNYPEVPRGGEQEVMRLKIRASNQGFVDTPHKIYAGNLSWNLTSQGLREAFEDLPGYFSAKVVYDNESGRSRGYGFVTFSTAEEVRSALEAMNGTEIDGRALRLNPAVKKPLLTANQTVNESGDDSLEDSQEGQVVYS